jgi:hypothetical protein
VERDQSSKPSSASDPIPGKDQKYCMDCGKIILRRAEICPGCGCRQTAASAVPQSASRSFPGYSTPASKELQGSFVAQMAMLLALNFLWNGLGNLALGDKRGWAWGFANWVVFAIGFFTVWIPSLLFFAYCGYAGYQFLTDQTYDAQPQTGAS